MEAPKCKTCGERHYGLCRGTREVAKVIQHLVKPLLPFDRATYQRDYMRKYMRKRRAAQKEQPR